MLSVRFAVAVCGCCCVVVVLAYNLNIIIGGRATVNNNLGCISAGYLYLRCIGSCMDGEEVQPTRISKDEYVRFKQFVQDTHGTTRGHLSTEIENALREYRQDNGAPERLARIEEDVSQVKALLADAEGDGGTDSLGGQVRAHAEPMDRPAPNAARESKIEYLAHRVQAECSVDGGYGEVTAAELRGVVVSEYNFEDDTADEYVDLLADWFGAVSHPNHGNTLVWGERLDEAKEEVGDAVSEEMDVITDAEREE